MINKTKVLAKADKLKTPVNHTQIATYSVSSTRFLTL